MSWVLSLTCFRNKLVPLPHPRLTKQIVAGLPPDDISTFFYDLPSTSSRRSKLIVPGVAENKLEIYNLLEVFEADPTKRLTSDFVYSGQ